MIKTPTERQIQFAGQIASVLGINFPQSSKDFTRKNYFEFIRDNLDEFNYALSESADPEDGFYLNDPWTEHY